MVLGVSLRFEKVLTKGLYHMAEKRTRDERVRSWSFLVYPESAPDQWRDILDDLHVEWVESPLHEYDTEPTGELKKPHWHVLLMFEGKKSYSQVKEIAQSVNATIPQVCHSAKGLVRYMAHLDSPHKYQYSASDIVAHGGVDIQELLKPTSSARHVLIREMMLFVKENNITEYYQLLDYAMKERFDDWFAILSDSATYVMNAYIKSIRHSKERCADGHE